MGPLEEEAKTTVADVISVIGRYEKREDFYEGVGYRRPAKGLLTKESFYESIRTKKFKKWPLDKNGKRFGEDSMSKEEFDALYKEITTSPPPQVCHLVLLLVGTLMSLVRIGDLHRNA